MIELQAEEVRSLLITCKWWPPQTPPHIIPVTVNAASHSHLPSAHLTFIHTFQRFRDNY